MESYLIRAQSQTERHHIRMQIMIDIEFSMRLPVFQITGCEDVGNRRHVRIHYH